MTALYFWIFTSKWIKLLGHYLRYPVDVLLLPISILFGYFHGAIKMYAVMTLNVVCIPHFQFFVCFLSPLSAGRVHAYVCLHPSAAPPNPVLPLTYESPVSQRFDPSPLLLAVYSSIMFPSMNLLLLDHVVIWLPFPYLALRPKAELTFAFSTRPHGVAVTELMTMTLSA